jgi:hypothetical protein
MVSEGTWMILDQASQQVGKVSNVPPTQVNSRLRVSYRRVFSTEKNMGLPGEVHEHGSGYDVAIYSESPLFSSGSWLYVLTIVGTNLSGIVKETHRFSHFFGACDLVGHKEVLRLLGAPSSFLGRCRFFFRWLIEGKDLITQQKSDVTFVSANESPDEVVPGTKSTVEKK